MLGFFFLTYTGKFSRTLLPSPIALKQFQQSDIISQAHGSLMSQPENSGESSVESLGEFLSEFLNTLLARRDVSKFCDIIICCREYGLFSGFHSTLLTNIVLSLFIYISSYSVKNILFLEFTSLTSFHLWHCYNIDSPMIFDC